MIELCTSYKNIDFTIHITVYDFTPGYPAKLNGPPENCYPEEPPEIEIISGWLEFDGDQELGTLTVESGTKIIATSFFDKVVATNETQLYEKMYKEVCENAAADMADYADYKRKERQEEGWR